MITRKKLSGEVKKQKGVTIVYGTGATLLANNYEIAKNVNLFTSLDLFSNYLENPENIDVNWTVLLGFKINDWLTASINTVLIYDADVTFTRINEETQLTETFGPAVQFKEVFNIGLSFNFGDKIED